LIFLYKKSYLDTFVIGVILGAIDELYQYLYLNPIAVPYYDFNDVVINAIGIGWGLIFIKSINHEFIKTSFSSFRKSAALKIILITFGIVLVGFLIGFISQGPSDNAILQITKSGYNPEFWIHLKHQVVYHILRPFEAFVLLLSLGILYLQLENYD